MPGRENEIKEGISLMARTATIAKERLLKQNTLKESYDIFMNIIKDLPQNGQIKNYQPAEDEMDIFAEDLSKFTRYEDVKDVSLEEYFYGSQFPMDTFSRKYMLEELNEKTPADVFWRVARYVAQAEKTKKDQEYWARRWFHEMWNNIWMAAGSVLNGAANPNRISLCNCTTLRFGEDEDFGDNLRDIHETAFAVSRTAASRQGLGVMFNLRPKEMPVHNSAKVSEGNTHWMKYINQIGQFVGQRGRIPAMLFAIKDHNPDLMDFITVKNDQTTIDNANISVHWSDKFMETLIAGGDWTMKYKTDTDTMTKTVPAREIFDAFVENNWAFAEPGAQFFDQAVKYSNSDYLDNSLLKIYGTNACTSGDTRILTDRGYFPIVDLVDREVNVWNGEKFAPVKPKITGRNQPLYRVQLSDGSYLDCTSNHEWLIEDQRVRTENLTPGQKLKKQMMPVVDHSSMEDYPKAYTQGFYCGDGWTTRTGSASALLYGEKMELVEHLEGKVTNAIPDHRDRIYIGFGKLHPKFTVPMNYSLKSRLEWLAGLIDADGNLTRNKNSFALTISSTKKDFLQEIRLMLTSMGVQAKVSKMHSDRTIKMPDGKGGKKDYHALATYRLLINATDTQNLLEMGLTLHRVKVELASPNRDARRFVTIESITPLEIAEKVYCFTEPETSQGTFNGILTGQCSEQYLESAGWKKSAGLCVLSSQNLARLPSNLLHAAWVTRYRVAPSMCRFLDNVVEMEIRDKRYALPGQLYSLKSLRRIGAGVTNMDGYLIQNDIGYSTDEGIQTMTYLLDQFNAGLYETSMALGEEKGNFEAFDREKYVQSPFVKQMMKRHGFDFQAMRNVCVSSIAPTGTLSWVFRDGVTSTGTEPVPAFYWWQRNRTSGSWEWSFVVPKFVREKLLGQGIDLKDYGLKAGAVRDDSGEIGVKVAKVIEEHFPKDKFKPAHEIDPFKKVDLMAALTRFCVDSSISVTYNLPEDVSKETVRDLYIYGWTQGLKSMAIYRDKSRIAVLEFVPPPEAEARYTDNESKETDTISVDPVDSIQTNQAPPRPDHLLGEVHHAKVHGEDWVAFVGLYYDRPYEVFAGKVENVNLSKKVKKGVIEKKGKNYFFYPENTEDKITLTKDFMEAEQSSLTRQVSLNLRHGTPLGYIIEQLEKSWGTVADFSKVLCRVLKKYGNRDDVNGVLQCSACDSKNLDFKEGCIICLDCGHGKC
jgi:ribonucleotide reductase alpha subunit